MGSGPSSSSSSTSILDRMRPSLLLTLLLILLLNASDAFLLGRSGLPSSRVAGPAPTVAAAAGVAVRGHGRRCKGACAMQRQTREVEVYDPSSYISIMKNQPVEWFDNTMSYGVFNWGLSSTGDMQKELKKIPIFPLNIVGTPGATRQLRVFEPRYRQLFQDIFNDKMGHNRTFGLVFTEGKGPAKVGCLMQVEMLQYENQRADRFMTWNLAVERFAIRSLNTQDQPYVVATAETGYEDLPLVQRLVPECDALEGKIEALVREILAYCIRWECKALEQERMTQLEPVANRCLKYSPQNRASLPSSLTESKRRELFTWSIIDLLSVGLQNNELQLMLQLRDIHARLVVLHELASRTHLWVSKGDNVLLDLMSTRLFR